MVKLLDPEFGEITLRRSRLSRSVRLKLDSRGLISISLPNRAPLSAARQLLNDARYNIRQSLGKIRERQTSYQHGDIIGKAHRLRIERTAAEWGQQLKKNELVVYAPAAALPQQVQATIRDGIAKALRAQAKAYLPRRLQTLAREHGFRYEKLRFSSAGTRWGSCSSSGTLSLNIWLMQLPFELIDYVIIHELCHTKQMNHSDEFWQLMREHCPGYKQHRRALKQYHPHA